MHECVWNTRSWGARSGAADEAGGAFPRQGTAAVWCLVPRRWGDLQIQREERRSRRAYRSEPGATHPPTLRCPDNARPRPVKAQDDASRLYKCSYDIYQHSREIAERRMAHGHTGLQAQPRKRITTGLTSPRLAPTSWPSGPPDRLLRRRRQIEGTLDAVDQHLHTDDREDQTHESAHDLDRVLPEHPHQPLAAEERHQGHEALWRHPNRGYIIFAVISSSSV